MLDIITCETVIHFLAGTREIPGIEYPKLDKADYNLINSLSRQLARRIAFTDRQYELAKTKIDYYAEQLPGLDLDTVKQTLELPLREIDRAKWIDIDEQNQNILIRFTFSKRLINNIEDLKRHINRDHWNYDKANKTHIVTYTERNLFDVVECFKDKNFELTPLVKELYETLKDLSADNYVPGVYNYEVKNMPQKGIDAITQELGTPTKDNIILYRDRAIRYGLDYIDDSDAFTEHNQLSTAIANRKSKSIIIHQDYVNIEDIVLALEELKRLPLIIVLPNQEAYDTLVTIHERIKNIIQPEDISTMFRMENDKEDGSYLNEYIRKENINNRLANNTKIVYTLENKVPKPLLKADFDPMALLVVSVGSSPLALRKLLGCYGDKDLIIHYSSKDSRSSSYFYDRNIETIKWQVVN